MTQPIRALIAVALDGEAFVLSTDSAVLAWDVNVINARCDDLEFQPRTTCPGLYLFTGEDKEVCVGPEYVTEREYAGTLSRVEASDPLLAELLAMEAPENKETP